MSYAEVWMKIISGEVEADWFPSWRGLLTLLQAPTVCLATQKRPGSDLTIFENRSIKIGCCNVFDFIMLDLSSVLMTNGWSIYQGP